jgi:hypothetical protein
VAELTTRPRTCRVTIRITDQKGESTPYHLVPSTPPEAVQGYRLHKLDLTPTVYHCTLETTGKVTCTCPGFRFHPSGGLCKHLAALQAMGMLDGAEYLRVEALRLEYEGRLAALQAPPAKPRRSRKKPAPAAEPVPA